MVGIVTGQASNRGSIAGSGKRPFSQSFQTSFRTHPASSTMGTVGSFLAGKMASLLLPLS